MQEDPPRLVHIGNGRHLAVRVRGSGPTVVLEAGGSGYGLDGWLGFEKSLASLATVVTYDRLGAGSSTAQTQDYPLPTEHANNLAALLDRLQIAEPVVLVGWSMGGLVAQQFAALFPQRVAAMLLLDPSAFGQHHPEIPEFLRRLSLLFSNLSNRRMAARVRGGALHNPKAKAGLLRKIQGSLGPRFPTELLPRLLDLASADAGIYENSTRLSNNLPKIFAEFSRTQARHALPRVPLIVILGGYLGKKPMGIAVRILRKLHAGYTAAIRQLGGEVLVLPDVSHQIPFEAPNECIQALRELLARLQ